MPSGTLASAPNRSATIWNSADDNYGPHAFALTTSQCWRKRLWGQARGFRRPSRNGPFKAFQSVGLHRVRSATALSMAS